MNHENLADIYRIFYSEFPYIILYSKALKNLRNTRNNCVLTLLMVFVICLAQRYHDASVSSLKHP